MKLPNFSDSAVKAKLIQPVAPYYIIHSVELELPKTISEVKHVVTSRKIIDPTVNLSTNTVKANFNYMFKISDEKSKKGKLYRKGCLIPELDLVPYYEGLQTTIDEKFDKIKRNLIRIQKIAFKNSLDAIGSDLSFVKVNKSHRSIITERSSKSYITKQGYEYKAACSSKGSIDSEEFIYNYMFYIKTENADAFVSLLGDVSMQFPSKEEFYNMFEATSEEDKIKVDNIVSEFLKFYSKNILPTTSDRLGNSRNYNADISRIINKFKSISKAELKKKKVQSNVENVTIQGINLPEIENTAFNYVQEIVEVINDVERFIEQSKVSFVSYFSDFYDTVNTSNKSTNYITYTPLIDNDRGNISFTSEFTIQTNGVLKDTKLFKSMDDVILNLIRQHNSNVENGAINYVNPYYGYLDIDDDTFIKSDYNYHNKLVDSDYTKNYFWINSDDPTKISIKLNINIQASPLLSYILKNWIIKNFPFYEDFINLYNSFDAVDNIMQGIEVRPMQKQSLVELIMSSLYSMFTKMEQKLNYPTQFFKDTYMNDDIMQKLESPFIVQLLHN